MTRGDLRRRLLAMRAELDSLLEDLVVETTTRPAAPAPDQTAERSVRSATADDPSLVAGGEAFRGAPIVANYAGRCGVCGGSYAAGESVVYRSDQKPSTAHVGCGIPDTSRRRRP